jgi:hypothetical protein
VCPCLLSGNKNIITITKIVGKKIIGNLIKISKNEKNLFLLIIITAKKGANNIICSHIKHRIGKKIKTIIFKTIGLNLFSEKKSVEIKNKNIKTSFLPNASSSAIG